LNYQNNIPFPIYIHIVITPECVRFLKNNIGKPSTYSLGFVGTIPAQNLSSKFPTIYTELPIK